MTTETVTQSDLSIPAAEPLAVADDPTDEEVLARRRERDRARKREQATGEYIGFVGCSRVGLLKVRVNSHEKHVMEVACTCGEVHTTTDPQIRERRPGEVVTLIEEGAPMTVGDDPAPRKPSKRPAPMKSDAAVLAAIPDDWTPATEVAETLGYGNRGSFINRLREMRERGAPLETRKEHRTAPMFVRRAVTT